MANLIQQYGGSGLTVYIRTAQDSFQGEQGHLGVIADHQFAALKDRPSQSLLAEALANLCQRVEFNCIAECIAHSTTQQTAKHPI